MHSDKASRRVLETFWRERLSLALSDYEGAKNTARRTAAEWRVQGMPIADGACAMRQALIIEREALREYMRVLQISHNLIVNDIIPSEDD